MLAGGEGARLSHLAAGALHGFDVKRVKSEITVPYERVSVIAGVEVHRTRRLGDLIVVRGIPVTNRPRTLLDVAAEMRSGYDELVQNAVACNLVDVESLLAIVDRRGGRGVEGTVRLRDALEDGLVDDKIESKLELIVARIIEAANVPRGVRQHPLRCADGREVRLDFAWPARKIGIDPDGRRWHANNHQAKKTRARSRSITGSGWAHYVYGWSEATEGAIETRREIESLFREGPPCPAHGEASRIGVGVTALPVATFDDRTAA